MFVTGIRSASSVILVRESTGFSRDLLQIYTIKRPDTMRFLPGFTAYPGGALEQGDESAEWDQYIGHDVQQDLLLSEMAPSAFPAPLTGGDLIRRKRAHLIAAMREVFEETGHLIGQAKQAGVAKYFEPSSLLHYRQALDRNEMTFYEVIKALNITLDDRQFIYAGRRLTPPISPIRFDTRFYVTYVPASVQLLPSVDEVAADAWIEPSRALELAERRMIQCAPPTVEIFRSLAQIDKQTQLIKHFTGG